MLCPFSTGLHPFVGVEEEGLNIMQHFLHCDRRGATSMITGVNLTYVSKHAMGRLHERGYDLTAIGAYR